MDSPHSSAPLERWSNRALWLLIWPLMVEQLLAVTIGMVDTVMVSSVGEAAVSGVSLVDSINVLLIQLFAAMATGGAVVASQYIGRGQPRLASEAARQLVYTVSLLSVLVMVIALVLRGPMLRLVYGHIAPDVMGNAETYFWLSALSYPFLALYNSAAALFRSMGNSRVSMLTALLINLLNIGGNSLFIYVFGWGVGGAALSTLISRAVAAVALIWLLLRGRGLPLSLAGLFRFKFNFKMVRNILGVGVPNGLENSMFQIGKLMVARIVSLFGTAAIAGNAMAGVLATFGNLPGAAVGLGLLTVVGQCVGAGDYTGAKRYTKKLMLVAYITMAASNGGMLLLARPLLGVFGLSAEALEIAYLCVMTHCALSIFFWPQSFALPNALRAAGDARFTMLVSMFSMWLFRIGFAYLFAIWLGLGVWGVWLAMVGDWIVRGSLFLLRWHGGKWQQKQVIK